MSSALLVAALLVAAVAAQCPADVGTTLQKDICKSFTDGCSAAQFLARISLLNSSATDPVMKGYLDCWHVGGACCVDECRVHKLKDSCVKSGQCAVLPGNGRTNQCVNKNKLCGLLTPEQAKPYIFCKQDVTPGMYDVPAEFIAAALDESAVTDKCPAMHPMVIAMLVLMFITLVAGVVVVAVVVIRNQKKADEEEARAEVAAAAAAEAKRARSRRV
jgi:hypothetical protein